MKRRLLTMSALALICSMSVACNNNKASNSTNTNQNSTTSQESTNNANANTNQNNTTSQESTNNSNTNVKITEEQAKKIALNDAKLSENDVIFAKSQLETENGVSSYDVEFYTKTKEYDYKIDAISGAVLEFDSEIENISIPQNNNNTNSSNSSTTNSTSNTNK